MEPSIEQVVERVSLWGPEGLGAPLSGGLTNQNYLVRGGSTDTWCGSPESRPSCWRSTA